ncbi:MAG: ATP-binding cassette domain-containing protein [Spirochaetaceae bacterium]
MPREQTGGSEPTAALLQAAGLGFAYHDRSVLEIDSFEVMRGSITAVTGANGSGKTTFFKVANGLLGPYTGRLRFDGIDVDLPRGRQELRRRSVYVHQHPYIFRERVWANVAFGLAVRGVRRRERHERIERALAAVGLGEFGERRATGLSGGERQRLAVARALALEPELLFLDEPTSNIDPASISRIETAIVEARRAGTTVLFCTHDYATAYRVADRIVTMEAGHVRPSSVNVYHGGITMRGGAVSHFSIPGGTIVVPSRHGEPTAAVVPMDDVFLARAALSTSAQNRFRGRVTEVRPFEDEQGSRLHRVGLDCGFPLHALVTAEALGELDIRPGEDLVAGFKASAVRLY